MDYQQYINLKNKISDTVEVDPTTDKESEDKVRGMGIKFRVRGYTDYGMYPPAEQYEDKSIEQIIEDFWKYLNKVYEDKGITEVEALRDKMRDTFEHVSATWNKLEQKETEPAIRLGLAYYTLETKLNILDRYIKKLLIFDDKSTLSKYDKEKAKQKERETIDHTAWTIVGDIVEKIQNANSSDEIAQILEEEGGDLNEAKGQKFTRGGDINSLNVCRVLQQIIAEDDRCVFRYDDIEPEYLAYTVFKNHLEWKGN